MGFLFPGDLSGGENPLGHGLLDDFGIMGAMEGEKMSIMMHTYARRKLRTGIIFYALMNSQERDLKIM